MIPGAVHRSPGFHLRAEENSGESQLGDSRRKTVRSVIASNGVPYLQMRSLGSHSTSGKDEEGKKGKDVPFEGLRCLRFLVILIFKLTRDIIQSMESVRSCVPGSRL